VNDNGKSSNSVHESNEQPFVIHRNHWASLLFELLHDGFKRLEESESI